VQAFKTKDKFGILSRFSRYYFKLLGVSGHILILTLDEGICLCEN
jgi:hypothetical protein